MSVFLSLNRLTVTLFSPDSPISTLPLLLASKALAGYSSTRAFMNVVQDLEAIGVPTGPMPDGSPNKFVASVYSILKGQEKEMTENGKVAIGIGPLTSLPTGITIPNDAYGKLI
ncbi:MAG: hypothetical protein ACOVOV_06640 [Dolichospermum sp.]